MRSLTTTSKLTLSVIPLYSLTLFVPESNDAYRHSKVSHITPKQNRNKCIPAPSECIETSTFSVGPVWGLRVRPRHLNKPVGDWRWSYCLSRWYRSFSTAHVIFDIQDIYRNIVSMMSIIFLVDQIFLNVYISLRWRKIHVRLLINSPSQWTQLINNLLNFPVIKKHVGVQMNPLNIHCSGQHLSCFGSTLIDKKKRSTSIFIASILHGHFEFLAAGLPFKGDTSVTPFCNHSMCWPETCEREWLPVWHGDVSCPSVFVLASNSAV